MDRFARFVTRRVIRSIVDDLELEWERSERDGSTITFTNVQLRMPRELEPVLRQMGGTVERYSAHFLRIRIGRNVHVNISGVRLVVHVGHEVSVHTKAHMERQLDRRWLFSLLALHAVRQAIPSQRSSGSGRLLPSDSFRQSSRVAAFAAKMMEQFTVCCSALPVADMSLRYRAIVAGDDDFYVPYDRLTWTICL